MVMEVKPHEQRKACPFGVAARQACHIQAVLMTSAAPKPCNAIPSHERGSGTHCPTPYQRPHHGGTLHMRDDALDAILHTLPLRLGKPPWPPSSASVARCHGWQAIGMACNGLGFHIAKRESKQLATIAGHGVSLSTADLCLIFVNGGIVELFTATPASSSTHAK